MPIIALLDRRRRSAGLDDLALDRLILAVEDLDAVAADDRPVALVQISDALGPGRDGQGVGAEVILAVAKADGERRAHSRSDHEVGMIAEQEGDGESALKPGKNIRHRILRRRAALDLAGDEMGDDLGIRLALELAPIGDELVAKRLEVLDDAVVDDGDRPDDVRMSIVDGGSAVGGPAGVGDADRSAQRLARQLAGQVFEFSFRSTARQLAMVDGADAGAIVAAIFEALEAVEQPLRDQRFPDNRNDPAHRPSVTQFLRTMPSNFHCRRNGARRQALLWHG